MRENLLKLIFSVVFSAAFTLAISQERTVSGRVTAAEDGSPVPGANVVVKGSTIGTVTDVNGGFTIEAPAGSTLIVSFVGLKTAEVFVGNNTSVNVSLASDDAQLNEVVVVGYGSISKTDLSGSVGSVKGDAIKNLPIPSLDRAIQGRMAGVQINASNGIPGGNTQVRIRGITSVSGGNEPLYIIDGVQVTGGDRSRRIQSSNVLNGINANDIESIEVLKDAAAASIYGAQAANGVIIITTKKGKQGAPKFEVNYYTGQTDVIKRLDLLKSSEWVQLREEALRNQYRPYDVYAEGLGNLYARTEVQRFYGDAASFSNYDWQAIASRRGDVQNIDLSASGGNQNNKYFISASYNKQNAQFLSTDFERFATRLNFDNKLSEKLTIETRLNLSTVTQRTPFAAGFNTNNVIVQAVGILPMNSPFRSDGTINGNFAYPGPLGSNSNPLWVNSLNPAKGITTQLIGNISANYAINKDLTFRSSYSMEYTDVTEDTFADPRTPAGGANNGVVQSLLTKIVNFTTDQTLNYTKTFNQRHNINALAGFTYRSEVVTGFNATGIGVASPAFGATLNGTTPNAVGSVYGIFKLTGLFARVNYVLDDKYVLSATIRRDGSSRFGTGNVFGLFPSVSAAWKINQESFMSNVAFVPELKLRASYGITGNQDIGNFSARSLFSTAVAFGYAGGGGISFNQLGNPTLQWEQVRSLNFGLDFALTKNKRVTGQIDYFQRTTANLLLPQILPATSGFTVITENVGSMVNRGWEFLISTQNLNKGGFTWSTDFNITFIENEVTKLLRDGEDLPNNGLWLGRPTGQQFQVRYAGVNPADGRSMWYDQGGNITYNPVSGDRVFMNRGSGSTLIPKYFGGLTNTFTYKGIEFSAFFQYNIGQLAFSNFAAFSASDFRFETNQLADIKRRWQNPGQITDIPRVYPGGQEAGSVPSWQGDGQTGHDRFIDDASYIRLKQVSLAYNLPSSLISKARLNSVRFYVQGVNLWTYTKYTGLDPEFAAGASDIGIVPQGRSVIAGVQIGF